jgi:hypothetical protein
MTHTATTSPSDFSPPLTGGAAKVVPAGFAPPTQEAGMIDRGTNLHAHQDGIKTVQIARNATTNQEVKMSKSYTKVSRPDAMKFSGWAHANADGIKDGTITYNDMRSFLVSLPGEHSAGYKNINNQSIRNLCKDAGITPPMGGGLARPGTAGGAGQARPSIADEIIIEAVTALYDKLGVAIPERLANVLERMRKDKEVDK